MAGFQSTLTLISLAVILSGLARCIHAHRGAFEWRGMQKISPPINAVMCAVNKCWSHLAV